VLGPRLRGFSFLQASSDSWIGRVRENFRQVFTPAALTPGSANGAPIHLLKFERSGRASRAQTVSLLTHGAILAAISLIVSQTVHQPDVTHQAFTNLGPLLYSPDTNRLTEKPSQGHTAGGGERAASPATRGFFAPGSPVQLAPPRLPDNAAHLLPITPTILDTQAPPIISPQNDLGLPWMPDKNGSAGPGSKGGIGAGNDGGMGDRDGPGGGEGEGNLPYSRGVSMPTCVTCPYPIYTDEARHAKMQGTVTLRVLVGADGRASDIRVVRGVGFGLEERAIQTVRGWKFKPARDANQRAVAAWVTIEAVFRLF
jgi:periplasmic protein TonB